MDAMDREALERAHLHALQADLELKRAIAGGLPVDADVARAQAFLRALTQRLAARLDATDGAPAQVIPFPPRGAR